MPKFLTHRARYRLAFALLGVVAVVILGAWGFELRQTIIAHDAREEEILSRHQQRELEIKADSFRDLFANIYQTSRTISLLPAIRAQAGGNQRHDGSPRSIDAVPGDTRQVLAQLFTNLRSVAPVSEIYYVLDGFAPERGEAPLISLGNEGWATQASARKAGAKVEDYQYAYFVRQLAWFRGAVPEFQVDRGGNPVPVLVSPLLRICGDGDFVVERDDPRNVLGLIHALPVFDVASQRFKGLIALTVSANQLEALLIGVPYLPVREADRKRAAGDGWKLPAQASPFLLTESRYGIEIADRRNPLFAAGAALARVKGQGRWASLPVDLHNDGRWTLHHYLSDADSTRLLRDERAARDFAVRGRFVLLGVLAALFGWGVWLFRSSRRELMWLAHYDPLTELPNRQLFFDRLQVALARARRNDTRVGLFYVDVADLNAVNDAFGHRAGDGILVDLSDRFRRHLRGYDALFRGRFRRMIGTDDTLPVVSRLGGDEFAILCEDIRSDDSIAAIADRILATVSQPFGVNGNRVELRLNIGVAVFPEDADEADGGERLVMCADSAMNECKQNRTSNWMMFNEATRARVERQHTLSLELQTALQRREFEVHYQPKASFADGRIVSLEALLRWKHPVLGSVSPVEFIPALERTGGIIEVGEWVLEQACSDLVRFSEAGYSNLRVSVNVSIRQIRRGNFHETVAAVLARFDIDPDRLILEITESMLFEDLDHGRKEMDRLRSLGVGLAIDDFGTGYSSLNYLQHLPVTWLKLDKQLIDGMVDARASHIVESVIRLAQGLSLRTVAEGIETEAQREHLRSMGCDVMQGFLLSRPLSIDDVLAWLAKRPRGG
jgi:diguanylate cyclase (GGDEF)-like protein